MRTVTELLRELGLPDPPVDIAFTNLQLDSRKIEAGGLFVALKGARENGTAYIEDAAGRGAVAALSETPVKKASIPVVHIENLRERISELAHVFYGRPTQKLFCVGVTGTNGKSTVVSLLTSLFKKMGRKVISLGTTGNCIGKKVYPANLTTPDALDLMALLKEGVDAGCDVLVMEVSSHALHQGRVSAIPFSRAVFTNLTQDHLDYHGTLDKYYQAKRRLFQELLIPEGVAVINLDNPYGERLLKEVRGFKAAYTTRENHPEAAVSLKNYKTALEGTRMEVTYEGVRHKYSSHLVGQFNLENLLALIALGVSVKAPSAVIQKAMNSVRVPGRLESVPLPSGGLAMVDYAHTPDALERVLQSVRPLIRGRLFCVFGCGGDRDKTKRPLMGKAAYENSDGVVITSDNPRTEDPLKIIEDVLKGLPHDNPGVVVTDRREAIYNALSRCEANDCVLIAGKGHEDYQILGNQRHSFSDVNVVRDWIHEQKKLQGAGNGR